MVVNYEARARAMVGFPFRPQGRDERGVDCLGLIVATYQIDDIRRNYRLRGDHLREALREFGKPFRKVGRDEARSGDALILRPADDQLHFAVRTERGFVHADAGIGRVVETPGWPGWPLIGVYRKRVRAR